MKHQLATMLLTALLCAIAAPGKAEGATHSVYNRTIDGGTVKIYGAVPTSDPAPAEITEAEEGSTVYLVAEPAAFHTTEGLELRVVMTANSSVAESRTRALGYAEEITPTLDAAGGYYTFTMPDGGWDAAIYATFPKRVQTVAYLDPTKPAGQQECQVEAYILDEPVEELVGSEEGTWYVCTGDVTYETSVTFSGNVHLILADGKTMSVENSNGDNAISGEPRSSLTIYGQSLGTGALVASAREYGIAHIGSFTLNGGRITATGIKGFVAISEITINGGVLNATGSYSGVDCTGVFTFNGGKVVAIGPDDRGIVSNNRNIVLGWTNPDDYIYASGYVPGSGTVSTAAGKRFVAYSVDYITAQSPVETACEIIPAGEITDLDDINEMMLRPLEKNFVSIPKGIEINVETPDFTIGTTDYYLMDEGDDVSITLGDYGQADVEINSTLDPDDITIYDARGTASFEMPADDVTITSLRYYITGAEYIDADGQPAETPAAEGETPATKVYILTGKETTLGEAGKEMWYISNTSGNGIAYNDQIKTYGTVHLILADGSKMTIDGSVVIEDDVMPINTLYARGPLTIYGQSNGTGELHANTRITALSVPDHALTLCGGIVTVRSNTAFNGNSLVIRGGKFTTLAETGTTNNTSVSGKNIQILGGQVDVNGAISSNYDIILGWTNTSDFIKASSYSTTGDGNVVKIADGKVLKYTSTGDNPVKLLHPGPISAQVKGEIAGKELTPAGLFGYCGAEDENNGRNVYWTIALKENDVTGDQELDNVLAIEKNTNVIDENYTYAMADYDDDGGPWKDYGFTVATIGEGVTAIDEDAFADCDALKLILVPTEADYATVADSWTGEAKAKLAPATITLTTNTSDWSTYCHTFPVSYDIADGADSDTKPDATAYTVSGLNSDKTAVTITESPVAPGVPLLLNYDGTTTGQLTLEADLETVSSVATPEAGATPITSEAASTDGSWNYYGNPGPEAFTDEGETQYIFAIGAGDTQSYILRGGSFIAVDNREGGIAAHRCWLNVSTASSNGARTLAITGEGSESTGMTPPLTPPLAGAGNDGGGNSGPESSQWYTLEGRRLQARPTVKGIYIHNGQKTVIK